MRTIKLNVNDNAYKKVMDLLKSLPQCDVVLNEDIDNENKVHRRLNALSLKTKGFKFDREEANAR